MANCLNRDLTEKEILRIKKEFVPDNWTLEQRRIVVNGGFGMRKDLRGSAIFATLISTGEYIKIDSFEIEENE